jgi:acetolactate synthase-1/2/3 large subunit
LNTGTDTAMVPDFVKLADAYGCLGIRVEKEEDIDAAIKLAIATNDRPVVIDFIVSRDSMVWPMVAAGLSNDEVQYARDAAPVWDGRE